MKTNYYYISVPGKCHFSKMGVKKCKDDKDYTGCLCFKEKADADLLCSELRNLMHFQEEETVSNPRRLFHITMPVAGQFSDLELMEVPDADPSTQKTYTYCLYFGSKDKAKKAIKEMKQCIFDFFSSKKEGEVPQPRPTWLNEEWLRTCKCKIDRT